MSKPEEPLEEEYVSDVSLEEEDEELIWRVFYSPLEERARHARSHEGNDEEDDGEDEGDEDDESDDYEDESDYSEDEMTDLSDIDDPELVAKYRELKQARIEHDLTEEQERRILLSSFTEEQMEKYESFRRTTVNKPGVKKIVNAVLGHSIPQNVAVVLAGLSKSLLGEIITRAFEVQEREFKAHLILDIDNKKKQKRKILQSLEEGREVEVDHFPLQYEGDRQRPLKPEHIQEAWRLYKLENSGIFNAQWRRQGEADGRMFR